MSDDRKRSAPSSDVDSQDMEDDRKPSASDVDTQDMEDDRKPSASTFQVDSQENSTLVIPVISDEESASRVWTLIELNGELLLPTEFPSADSPSTAIMGPDHVELGSLRFDEDGAPVMILGSHELKGNVEELKDPFCVFEKIRGKASGMTDENSTPDLQYKVVGVVHKKLLFNNYPKTIMK